MTKIIYKFTIAVKYSFSGLYVISTEEYYLPNLDACMSIAERYKTCFRFGELEKVEIKRMPVSNNATI